MWQPVIVGALFLGRGFGEWHALNGVSLNKRSKNPVVLFDLLFKLTHISKVQFRWPLGMPLVRSLGSGIHEVRSHIPNGIARILFIVTNKTMVLLHGLVKKTEKLPTQDLKIATERAKNYEQHEKK